MNQIEQIANEEGKKLYKENNIEYKFDHYDEEVKLVFVKQTNFAGGLLTHKMLAPLVERLQKINRRWYMGIMTNAKTLKRQMQ